MHAKFTEQDSDMNLDGALSKVERPRNFLV
jgi:hypothetical protein